MALFSDPFMLMLVFATFLLAGLVKGVVGLGMPTVSLVLLALVLDLPSAMALLLVPTFATNLWQALVGPHLLEVLRRTWPFLLLATLMIGPGSIMLVLVELSWLTLLLGLSLILYGLVGLAGWRFDLSARQDRWAGPSLGALNGVLTGMTGAFAVPGVFYLQALGLSRDQLIQAMGLLFGLSTVGLAVSLGGQGFLDGEMGVQSALALVPALLGMLAGQKIRQRLSEQLFRRLLFLALLFMGLYMAGQSALQLV
ncbi:TSUP family transporter [Rhodovibrionaceae bacterium A322]